ncbi:MAG: tetratricopeptide repeat protein [Euryarchaeota archaeon]|nr:tetratricopeptide repeat protein [Euryarchaeota archaeon]
MRPKKDSYIFTVAERVLLLLMEYHAVRDFEVPVELTQLGIGRLLKVRRGNISRYLTRLMDGRLVQALKGRPKGSKVRTLYYVLTENGYSEAKRLRSLAAKASITVHFPSQEIRTNVYDASAILPGKPSMTEVITAVKDGGMEVTGFVRERAKAGGGMFKASAEMPTVERFYGREVELERIGAWFDSKESRILSLTGVAGIGKTTLLARAASSWLSRSHVFWFRVREFDTPSSIAQSISVFLSTIENAPVPQAIAERGVDLGLMTYTLTECVANTSIVFVFDDIYKASGEVLNVVRAITDTVLGNPHIKLATTSRKSVKLADGRTLLSGAQTAMKIFGLQPPAAAYILPRGIGDYGDAAKNLIKKTSGHPLLLRMAFTGADGDRDASKYIHEEIVAGATEHEGRAIALLSLLRRPVAKVDLYNLGIGDDVLESIDERGLVAKDDAGNYEIHDMIKEYLIGRMGQREIAAMHRAIGEMYSSLPGELFAVEAIHHHSKARNYTAGVSLLIDHGDTIIAYGMSSQIAESVRELYENHIPEKHHAGKYYRIAGDIFEQACDWDEALKAYDEAGEGEDRAQAILALTRKAGLLFRVGKLGDAKRAALRAIKLSEHSDTTEGCGEAYYSYGNLAFEERNIPEAVRAFKKAIEISRRTGSARLEAQATYGLGRVEHAQGHLRQAIKSKEKAITLFEKINDKVELCKVLTSIGNTYQADGDSKRALENFEKAIHQCEEIGNPLLLAYSRANAGAMSIKLPNFEKAENNLIKALKVFEGLGEKAGMSAVCLNLSLVYGKKGISDKALSFAEKGWKIAMERGIPRDIAKANAILGETLLSQKRHREAKKYLRAALSYAKSMGDARFIKEMEKDLMSLASESRPTMGR